MRSQKFGASIRKSVDKSLNSKKAKYECPRCNKLQLKNVSFSTWRCKSCGNIIAGGAYSPTTEAGEINTRLVGEYQKSA